MNEKILVENGYSEEQAQIYLYLLKNGGKTAKDIYRNLGINRSMIYKVLSQLKTLELVSEHDEADMVALFYASHPQKIMDTIYEKAHKTEQAKESFKSIYNNLSGQFNIFTGKPNVHFLDGVDGLKEIYEDIIDINKKISIISSSVKPNQEVQDLIIKNIEKQKDLSIDCRVISPILGLKDYKDRVKNDKENKEIDRKLVEAKDLPTSSQIIIYGDKVAITSFENNLVQSVLIESNSIKNFFLTLYEYLWKIN